MWRKCQKLLQNAGVTAENNEVSVTKQDRIPSEEVNKRMIFLFFQFLWISFLSFYLCSFVTATRLSMCRFSRQALRKEQIAAFSWCFLLFCLSGRLGVCQSRNSVWHAVPDKVLARRFLQRLHRPDAIRWNIQGRKGNSFGPAAESGSASDSNIKASFGFSTGDLDETPKIGLMCFGHEAVLVSLPLCLGSPLQHCRRTGWPLILRVLAEDKVTRCKLMCGHSNATGEGKMSL